MPTSPSPRSEQLGTPNPPAIRFTRGTSFGASRFTHLLRPAKLLAPLYGSDRYARPSGAFTSRLPTDRLPSPLLDMTTTATGLLCWRDLHPLEWQLASLHQNRTGPIRAYGSHLGCVTAKRFSLRLAVCAPAPVTHLPGSASGACFAGSHSPWPLPFAPPAPRRSRPLCSSASQLLWQSLTSRGRASSATAPRLPDADRRQLPNGRSRDLPVPAQGASAHARFFDHAGSFGPCDGASETCCLPHSKRRRHPGIGFRGSMAGLCPPLPTLRRRPRGRQHTARGRCGSLLLHRSGLAPPTPCRSPGALRVLPPQPRSPVSVGYVRSARIGATFPSQWTAGAVKGKLLNEILLRSCMAAFAIGVVIAAASFSVTQSKGMRFSV